MEQSRAQCPVCARDSEAGTLRCVCGCLFLDQVLKLPSEEAESLLASNAAWLHTERSMGRRMLLQSLAVGFLPLVFTVAAIAYVAPALGVISGSLLAVSAAWGNRGRIRASTARRMAEANRIALPPARLHSRT